MPSIEVYPKILKRNSSRSRILLADFDHPSEFTAPLDHGLILAGSILILLFIAQFANEWTLNPQYSYGWGVPLLGIFLLIRRWQERPAPQRFQAPKAIWVCAAISLFAWLPMRILREANMDWRLLEWIVAGGIVGLLFALCALSGGSPFVRHFRFPILFLLVAVPWPTRLEAFTVQSLSSLAVKMDVEALRWMGIPAWAAGNVIQLPTTRVGVEDACSGIQALQGSIMSALFLGELFRLSGKRRAVLAVLGCVTAVLVNSGRSLVLAMVAASHPQMTEWHDNAGLVTLLACFGFLLGMALLLRNNLSQRLGESARSDVLPRAIPLSSPAALISWVLLVELLNHAWFGASRRLGTAHPLELRLSATRDMRPAKIPDRIRSILRFDEGELFHRSASDGSDWWVYALRWNSASVGAPLARYHSPEICLPAAGFKLVQAPEPIAARMGGVPFRVSTFEWVGRPVFVFSCYLSENGAAPVSSFAEFDLDWKKRFSLALNHSRPGAQHVIQIVVSGVNSRQRAERAFHEVAAQMFGS